MPRYELYGDGPDFIEWRAGSGNTLEIFDIAVRSERRQGRGRQLVQHLFSQFPDAPLVWAITRGDNEVAQHFYAALRFRVVGVLRRFYGDSDRTADMGIVYGRSPRGPV